MAEIVYMPQLSDTMVEGVVASWFKKVGDKVAEGEILAEIETDKATMEFESFYNGVLLHIGVEKGQAVPVNTLLAIIGEPGEDITAALASGPAAAPAKEVVKESAPAPSPAPVAETAKVEVKSVVTPSVAATPVYTPNADGRVFASPLAKKLAEERGIDISQIAGTGEGGRIVKTDVDHFKAYVPANRGGFTPAAPGVESFTTETVSQMRKTIARRLAESKFTAPHFYLTMDIDMDNAISARTQLNSVGGAKVSFNDMVVKAVALSLKQHPVINSSWLGDTIRRNQHVHIGVAVAVDEGLLVPVVRFADTKGLNQIGAEVKEFAQKAKDKKLQPADWEGNTFTISNLGMFGIQSFTAIVNTPDSCILAVGGIKAIPVVKNGQVVPGNVMNVTLSCDHRVVDGASGAAFLNTFKAFLENPVTMLVG
jgi:pyruvate dehydrogenase E2 component (dihydrolipoamide acetyltransferase)